MDQIERDMRQREAHELERLQRRLDELDTPAVIPHDESDEEGE